MSLRIKNIKNFYYLYVSLSLIWCLGFVIFAFSLPVKIEDSVSTTDAIVVLTGGIGRLKEGFDLLEQEKAKRILISGVAATVSLKDLLKTSHFFNITQPSLIDIGREANDTVGNAVETSQWMAHHGYQSLRLVTSYYHIPRSLIEFKKQMPHVHVICHPVFPENFNPAHWFENSKNIFLIIMEYNKYLVARLRTLW